MLRSLLPNTKGEVLLYAVDVSSLSILTVQYYTDALGLFVMFITAVSVTFTLGVKIYNFLKKK